MKNTFRTLLLLVLLALDQMLSQSVECTSLANYLNADSRDEFKIFMGGGVVPAHAPVFFDIPRMSILDTPGMQVKLCLEDIPIPESVGANNCSEWNSCWLVVGKQAGADLDPEDVKSCESRYEKSQTTSCYQCVCSGYEFSYGRSEQGNSTLDYACGIDHKPGSWSAVCPNVPNTQFPFADNHSYSETQPSHAMVQINVCGQIAGEYSYSCQTCTDGYHPQFQVGLQWITTSEQCFDDLPFSDGAGLHLAWFVKVLSFVIFFLFGGA